MTNPDVCVLLYRSCGHQIVAGARSTIEATAAKLTGVTTRTATDQDLLALIQPRDRRCLCRVRDGSVLAAWHKVVTSAVSR